MWFKKKHDFEAILKKYLDRDFSVFACGENAPDEAVLRTFERELGFKLPDDFRDFSKSSLGGVYVEVKEDIWPRAEPFEAGPFWSFLYGLVVYGFAGDVPEWMDMRIQTEAFRRDTQSNYAPFFKVIGDVDLYCFGKDQSISRWEHETGEFARVDKAFVELLDFELGELRARKDRKKAEPRDPPSDGSQAQRP